MRIVTVSRKPLVASSATTNVVRHQAGAINIDATRIRTSTDDDIHAKNPHTVGGFGHAGAQVYRTSSTPPAYDPSAGRWPANVLLIHRATCRVVGRRKVKSGKAVRHRSGGKTIFSETDKKSLPDMTYGDEDGKETIAQWACEGPCPVPEIDHQSGTLKSGSGTVKRASSRDGHGNRAQALGAESRKAGTPQIWYGDAGGASRFFRQIVRR